MTANSGTAGAAENPDPAEGIAGDGEERRRLILDSALDAILSMDSQGRILDWNKRAESLFGWRASEVVGKPLVEVVIPERFRGAHARGMRHFLETGEGPILNHRIEVEGLRRDGTEFPVELTVTPGRIGGEWIFSSFLRDLTEQKAAASRLR
jgi:PAS domain S-box-containing protein